MRGEFLGTLHTTKIVIAIGHCQELLPQGERYIFDQSSNILG
jgi:hypothetical protein